MSTQAISKFNVVWIVPRGTLNVRIPYIEDSFKYLAEVNEDDSIPPNQSHVTYFDVNYDYNIKGFRRVALPDGAMIQIVESD